MGDRLKRRKKGGEASKDQAKANAPEPLQPKYFESEISGKPAMSEVEMASDTSSSMPQPAMAEGPTPELPGAQAPAPTRPVAQKSAPQRSAPQRSAPQRSVSQRSVPQRSAASRVALPEQSAMEGTEAENRAEKETQADFLLGSRGAPELPLAAAVSGENRGRSQNQDRPARRRRKRGGRGGAARRVPVTSPGAGATRGFAPAETGGAETAADIDNFAQPLTPESVGSEAATVVSAAVPAPTSSSAASLSAASVTSPTVVAGAVPASAAVAARPSKGTVVLAIGLPGSGKSSWFKRHDIHPLSSDLLRELLFDDAQEQRFQDLVFSNLRSMLKARLIARRPLNYVDATNLTPHDRHSWIKLAKDYGYDVQGLFFDVPLEVCLERHARRGRAVPEEIMRKMAGKLKPPTFEEGFSKITVVRVKQKDAAAE